MIHGLRDIPAAPLLAEIAGAALYVAVWLGATALVVVGMGVLLP